MGSSLPGLYPPPGRACWSQLPVQEVACDCPKGCPSWGRWVGEMLVPDRGASRQSTKRPGLADVSCWGVARKWNPHHTFSGRPPGLLSYKGWGTQTGHSFSGSSPPLPEPSIQQGPGRGPENLHSHQAPRWGCCSCVPDLSVAKPRLVEKADYRALPQQSRHRKSGPGTQHHRQAPRQFLSHWPQTTGAASPELPS